MKQIIHLFLHTGNIRPDAFPVQPFPELTEREKEILAPIAQHLTNMEIKALSMVLPWKK